MSMGRRPDANEASGRPVRSWCARSAAPALNVPKPTEWPSKQATMFPSERASSVTWPTSRAAKVTGAARRARLVPGARKPGPSGLGVKRIELVFRQRPVAQSELDRNIVKPARREAAIEMPQPRNDHPDDRGFDVGAGLVEHEEIEACALGQVHAGGYLRAGVELAEIRVEVGSDDRSTARRQIGMVLSRNGGEPS